MPPRHLRLHTLPPAYAQKQESMPCFCGRGTILNGHRAPRGKLRLAFSVQGRSAGPEVGRGVPTPPSLPLDSTHSATQQLRPQPAAETGSSCWGSGQQDASAAQGTKRMLGAATRRQGLHALNNPKEEVEAQKSYRCASRRYRFNAFFASPFIAPQSLRDSSPKGEQAPARSAALSQRAARQMPFPSTTPPVKK